MKGTNKANDIQDRFRGCLLGLAVGDALGTTLEFKSRGSFTPIDDMVGGGPFRLRAGQWTDDTSMALCLATSLIECNGFDPQDQMERYCRWHDEGYLSSTGECFDIGNTVASALRQFKQTRDPYSGPTDSFSAGNGSLMRLAPIPMFYAANGSLAIEMAAKSSRTTHGAAEAIDACRYATGVLVSALNGSDKEAMLESKHSPVAGFWETEPLEERIDEIARGSFKHKSSSEITGSGYVVESLEAALWAFHESDSFKEGALLAVNLGDDADTTGAIYGQFAGAYYGASGIPTDWLNLLTMREEITKLADELTRVTTD